MLPEGVDDKDCCDIDVSPEIKARNSIINQLSPTRKCKHASNEKQLALLCRHRSPLGPTATCAPMLDSRGREKPGGR